MTELTRRNFTKLIGAAGASAAASTSVFAGSHMKGKGRVVVIGGGAGGATAAHLIKRGSPKLDVTLIEVNKQYTTCFFSNLYLGGFRSFESITHSYDGLKKLGIKVVHDWAANVDTGKKTVSMKSGGTIAYDKLILSPGIDFKWDTIEGYDAAAAEMIPHAYQAGRQTQILKKQLMDMKDGGTFIICSPPNPMRCPPGPGERISMVANYFKKNKPKSKIILLDPKRKFSKYGLFMDGWKRHYKGMIEVHTSDDLDNFGAVKVDVASKTVTTKGGKTFKADVLNIIPAMKAGKIVHTAGLTKGDWCPINPADFSSKLAKDVHVLGDSSIASAMPKSGFSANSQAKVVANAVQAALSGKKQFPARFRNTCWSLISDNDGVKVGASYKAGKEKVDKTSGFISKTGEPADQREATFKESLGWYDGITQDMFAKS